MLGALGVLCCIFDFGWEAQSTFNGITLLISSSENPEWWQLPLVRTRLQTRELWFRSCFNSEVLRSCRVCREVTVHAIKNSKVIFAFRKDNRWMLNTWDFRKKAEKWGNGCLDNLVLKGMPFRAVGKKFPRHEKNFPRQEIVNGTAGNFFSRQEILADAAGSRKRHQLSSKTNPSAKFQARIHVQQRRCLLVHRFRLQLRQVWRLCRVCGCLRKTRNPEGFKNLRGFVLRWNCFCTTENWSTSGGVRKQTFKGETMSLAHVFIGFANWRNR